MKQRFLVLGVALSLMGGLAGCQAGFVAEPAAIEITPLATAVVVEEPAVMVEAEPVVESAAVGLIFNVYDREPMMGMVDGTAEGYKVVSDKPLGLLSPSGQKLLYRDDMGQFYVFNLVTGEDKRLETDKLVGTTNAHQWIDDNQVLIGVWLSEDEQGPNTGHLAIYDLVTDVRLIITTELTGSLATLSPDGKTIAYAGEFPYLYDMETEITTQFDPTVFAGWDHSEDVRFGSPSWSPDGDQIVWIVGGTFDGKWQIGTAVFDLTNQTARLLHPYEPVGRGGWPGPAEFSPDGRWMAVEEWPTDWTQSGIWVYELYGDSSFHAAEKSSWPIWSLDGTALFFNQVKEDGVMGLTMFDIARGEAQALDMVPNGAMPVGFAASYPQLP